MKRQIKNNIILTAAIALLGLSACEASDPATTQNTSVAPTPVTALELAKAYDDNEAAAQAKYGNKPLLVTGTVSAITLDFADNPVVQMKGVNEFSDLQLSLAEKAKAQAATVKKGDQMTLRCESVSEVIGSPMLSDCTFTDAAPTNSKAADQ